MQGVLARTLLYIAVYVLQGNLEMKSKLNKILVLTARKSLFMAVLVGSIVLGAGSADVMAVVETDFLYNLSNFSGPVPFDKANIFVDKARNEIYVGDPRGSGIRIFDKNGMEIYRFGDDGSLGLVVDVVVKKDGGILVLSKRGSTSAIIVCNFRGERLSELKLKNLPGDFSNFSADRMAYRQGRLYLLSSSSMRIVVTDTDGLFWKGYDIASLLEVEEKKRGETDISGFSVDREGNMLLTVPVFFAAYRLSPDGKIKGFGRPGSAPGRFNIVGGIVADDRGNIYVADQLKSAVIVFDKNFEFLKEFGYRGLRPDNLIGPMNLVLDSRNRLYVSQRRSRGISVFQITHR